MKVKMKTILDKVLAWLFQPAADIHEAKYRHGVNPIRRS